MKKYAPISLYLQDYIRMHGQQNLKNVTSFAVSAKKWHRNENGDSLVPVVEMTRAKVTDFWKFSGSQSLFSFKQLRSVTLSGIWTSVIPDLSMSQVSPCQSRTRSNSYFNFFNLIFMVPSIMLYSSEISPRCNNCVFILRNGFTLNVSGDNLTHHQEYICCIWPQLRRLT